MQCGCLPLKQQYAEKFRLVGYGVLSALIMLISVLVRNGLSALDAVASDGLVRAFGALCLVEVVAALAAGFAFASFPRRPDVYLGEELVDQQRTVSMLKLLSFSWNRPIFDMAKERRLDMADLPKLGASTRSKNLNAGYLAGEQKGRLWWLLIKHYSPALAVQWTLTAITSALAMFPQYALYHFLEKLETRHMYEGSDPRLWVWVAALCFSLLLQVCVSNAMSWLTMSQLNTPLSSLIQTLVFQKSLRLHEVSSPPSEGLDDKSKDKDAKDKADNEKKPPKPMNMRQSVVNHMKLDRFVSPLISGRDTISADHFIASD